jgi:hypothetical protein
MDDLIAAYPAFLKAVSDDQLIWTKGAPTPLKFGQPPRTAEAVLADARVEDIFAWDYPLGSKRAARADPGRARPAAFFNRIYGDCKSDAVEKLLVPVRWVQGQSVRVTNRNGVARALAALAVDLEAEGLGRAPYLWPISGTYNCRTVAGTSSPSMHSYGAAIDLSSAYGAYWRWNKRPASGKVIPDQVVAIFERHGFIWGGKWAHYDSFHFEYRPELIRAARRAALKPNS